MAEGQHPNRRERQPGSLADAPATAPTGPLPFRLEHLWLVDRTGGTRPIAAMTFGEDGIGVVETPGALPRILPWSSVLAHAVEPWRGGTVPEWWVDPELNVPGATDGPLDLTDPSSTSRSRHETEAGAVIVIQTSGGVHRFLSPGTEAPALSRRVGALALRYQGTAATPATRVVAWGQDVERRRTERPPARPPAWPRVRPYLVVILILVVAAAITLILLQSAGTIHLPLLGGSTPGAVAPARSR